MKDFNKEEYNKLCAEFLGWELKSYPTYMNTPFSGKSIWFSPTSSDGKTRTFACERGNEFFDSDWNWIMEVVEQIENLGGAVCIGNSSIILIVFCKENGELGEEYSNTTGYPDETKKEAVVRAIWIFLNWYKENKN
jgi:hypothetical protein